MDILSETEKTEIIYTMQLSYKRMLYILKRDFNFIRLYTGRTLI